MRILFAGFQHETNTFAPDLADGAAFAHGGGFPGLCRGADVITALVPTANIPGAGFLAAAKAAGDQLVPILWCAACPSGFVARETYESIATEIVEGIRAGRPADAVYLDLHGAMVAQHVEDGEGELLARVRAVIGPDLPLVVSLDLHANVTARMLSLADAVVAFRTYPHVDMAETGRKAHVLLQDRVARGKRLAIASRRLPYMMPICWQATEEEPARGLYQSLERIEAAQNLPSISYTMGFPAADFPECGPVVWAYGETQAQADAAADALYADVLAAEPRFAGPLYTPGAVMAEALRLNAAGIRPVVIADPQDNPGAGGSSDTMGLLKAMIAHDLPRGVIGVIHDPQAVQLAQAAGQGASITLSLGGRSGSKGDSPLVESFTVEALSDGKLHTLGPYYGKREMDLGPAVCLRHGGVRVVVASEKAQLADREMLRFLGVDPEGEDIVVVKSAIHFRADFRPIAGAILTAIAPGAMMMRATDWTWHNLPEGLRLMPGGPAFHRSGAQA